MTYIARGKAFVGWVAQHGGRRDPTLTRAEIRLLLKRGAKNAAELQKRIAPMFQLDASTANLRLD